MNSPVRHKESALRPNNLHARVPPAMEAEVVIGVCAAILAMRADEPVVAVLSGEANGQMRDDSLPCEPFCPREHDALEGGLHSLVERTTGLELAHVEQLRTFGEAACSDPSAPRTVVVSVSYLGLAGPVLNDGRCRATWRSWYDYLPWEDWRKGRPACLARLEPHLAAWADDEPPDTAEATGFDRRRRVRFAFGSGGNTWDEEKVLQRYELLCEAGLAGSGAATRQGSNAPALPPARLSDAAQGDQVRVLASAIGILRRAIKVRPAIFELMPQVFTLFELQRTVEAILGPHLHKQNFRRLVEGGGLVEPTGDYRFRTGGRPAQLFRFRPEVLLERQSPGVRVKAGRA